MTSDRLQIQHLDKKMQVLATVQRSGVPNTGWIKAVRKALGISGQQLADKLNITKQAVAAIEDREQNGTITIKLLQETAQKMNMQVVYGFVPEDGTLDALIERKAKALAKQIVMRTSASMLLEDQKNSPERLEKAIEELTEKIKQEMPKKLWE